MDNVAKNMVNLIVRFAKDVVSVADGRPIVLFGRDCFVIALYIRIILRIKCQYFLFSRRQTEDGSTLAQWRKEVPPGSMIFDTGFRGTILRAAKAMDTTIVGGGMMSADDFESYAKQITLPICGEWKDYEHRELVLALEHFPKSIGRCVGYSLEGIALTDDNDRESEQYVEGEDVFARTYLLLRELGFSIRDASKFCRFTGKFPHERIGCGKNEVEKHYKEVEKARRRHDDDNVEEWIKMFRGWTTPLTNSQRKMIVEFLDRNSGSYSDMDTTLCDDFTFMTLQRGYAFEISE